MPVKLGNEFLLALIDRGLVPDDTIAVDIRIRVGEPPIMTIERMPEAEQIEYFLDLIGSAERLVPLPPKPRIEKPPATEMRGV